MAEFRSPPPTLDAGPSTDDPPVDGCLCTGGTTNVTVNKTGGDDPTTPPTYVVVPRGHAEGRKGGALCSMLPST